MKTIEQLKKEIRKEKARIYFEKSYGEDKQRRKQLKNELIRLKYQKPIKVATTITNSFKGIGRGIGQGIKKIEEQGKIKQSKIINKKKKVQKESFADLINTIP